MDTSPSTDPSSAEAPLVLRHDADRIATLTLDSPENRNALSSRLVGELAGHLRDIEADDTVRAVVLTHTSHTSCAGADLAEGAREGGPAKGVARLVALLRQIVELDKPVVAKVEGNVRAVSYTHLRAHETVLDLVCRHLLDKKTNQTNCR